MHVPFTSFAAVDTFLFHFACTTEISHFFSPLSPLYILLFSSVASSSAFVSFLSFLDVFFLPVMILSTVGQADTIGTIHAHT